MNYAVIDTNIYLVVTITTEYYDPGAPYIVVASDTAEVGDTYNPTTHEFTPPVPTPAQKLVSVYNDAMAAGYTTGGHNYNFSAIADWVTQVIVAIDELETDTALMNDGNGNLISLTNAAIKTIYLGLVNTIQSIKYAQVTVQAQINAATLTDQSLVAAAFATAQAAAPSRTELTSLVSLIGIVNSINTTIAGVVSTSTMNTAISTAINNLVNSAPGTLDTLGEIATALATDESMSAALATTVANKVDKITGKGLSTNDYTTADKNKVAASQSSTDVASAIASAIAALVNSAPGTLDTLGEIAAALAADESAAAALATVVGGKVDKVTNRGLSALYDGTALRANPVTVFKSAVVASGVAVFHFTADGTSTGAALFPNGPILASVNPVVNDATASYQYGWAWSNSNKTLTITTNKLTTANILTGLLGQAAANGSTVNVSVAGY